MAGFAGSQATTDRATDQALRAWAALLRAHASATRALNAALVAEHALTINDYEALLVLSRAPEHGLRRVDLAAELLLSASGVTRLLEGLEQAGYVEKRACPEDGRVTYAVITDAGREKLASAACGHVASICGLFEQRFDDDQLDALAELLARLPGAADAEPCTP